MNEVITINFDLIPTSLRQDWERLNSPFYVVPPPSEDPKKRYIDSTLVEASRTVTLEDWLRDNGLYIDFKASSETIESAHFFQPNEEEIRNASFYNIVWSDLKYQIGFETYNHYERYVEIMVVGDTLGYQFYDKFSKTANCYSIPLFDSIVANNELLDSDSFEFALLEGKVKFFRTIKAERIDKYYDYSDIPK